MKAFGSVLIPKSRIHAAFATMLLPRLKAIKVPNVRWPGGCFADEYHWRKGIGPQRAVTLNPNWGGVTEPNTFGTHEFMDFIDQIGADAYVSVNVGSGTPQEAAEWLEYMTAAAADDAGERTRCQRASRSVQSRLSRHR